MTGRARGPVGLIVPPAAGEVPPEAPVLYPDVRFTATGLGIGAVTSRNFDEALRRLPDAVHGLREAGAQAISLMGTSISFYGGAAGHEALLDALRSAAGRLPVTTMAAAVVRGLESVHARRIVVGSAYVPELATALVRFLGEAGFTVVRDRHLNLAGLPAIHGTPATVLEELGAGLLEECPVADALLISCGGLRTLGPARALESRFRVPVISSAVAGVHDAVALLPARSS